MADQLAELEARVERLEGLFDRILALLEKFGPMIDRLGGSKLTFRKKDS